MISPFGTSTPSSTPATGNPFAPTVKTNPSGQDAGSSSLFGAKLNTRNPFAQGLGESAAAVNANGTRNPFIPAKNDAAANGDKDKQAAAWGRQQLNGAQPWARLGRVADATTSQGNFDNSASKVKQASAPGFGQTAEDVPVSDDPHAKKVFEQLRRDNVRPPAWPSQPGDVKSKGQMVKFREQYEDYRSKVRASLTRAGLIDDPSKRKTLQHAIEFRGICQDMCPAYEKITRITEHDIPTAERYPQSTAADTSRMVKKLARSAAGQEAPLPMDVLSVPTLRKTLNYLIDDLLRSDENLATLHGYLWDRTRAIRRDFTFFSSLSTQEAKIQASVLEDIVRFHVTSLHLLSQSGKVPEDFVEQQELEQLGKALLTLRDIYDDCLALGSPCENEAEFRAYYLLFHAYDPNILEIVQRQWRPSLWKEYDVIRTAVSLVEALQNTCDFHGPLQEGPSLAASGAHSVYFRIVEDPKVSYTLACFAECHFPSLRRSILRNINKALARPKEAAHDVTATDLNKFLRFDTVQQAMDFAELHGLKFQPNPQNPTVGNLSCLVLHSRFHIPHLRLPHQFSQTLVESKRGSRSLPIVLHSTVYAAANLSTQAQEKASLASEGSLFVQEDEEMPPKSPASNTAAPLSSASISVPPPPPLPLPEYSPFETFGWPSINGNATINPFGKAPSPPTDQSSKAGPSTDRVQMPTKQSTTTFFAATNTSNAPERPAASLNLDGAVQPNHTFPFIAPTNTGTTTPFGNMTTESGHFKPIFGFAKTDATESTNSAVSGVSTSSSNNTAAPPSFGFSIPPKAVETFATLHSETPQRNPSAFSSFPPLSQTVKPQEFTKNFTPPGSPAQPASVTQVPTPVVHKPLLQPSAPTCVKEPDTALFNSTTPTPTPTPVFSPFGPATTSQALASGTMTSGPAAPPTPLLPKRDKLLDFTTWFVKGDDGLMAEFEQHYLQGLLEPLFVEWRQQEEEKQRREEEARDGAVADEFRRRCLSVNYFYRWKANAREKRLRFLRRSGREQLRQFYQSQQHSTASRIPRATTTPSRSNKLAAVAMASPVSRPEREKSLVEGLRESQAKKRYIPRPPSSSSETAAAAAIAIGRHFNLPMPPSAMTSPTRSRSSSTSKGGGGSKTRALREALLGKGAGGGTRSLGGERFGRSLTSVASSAGDSSRDSVRSSGARSRVSERWRLKAMGIVQLPDGTAVPESLLADGRFNDAYSHDGGGRGRRGPAVGSSLISRFSSSSSRHARNGIQVPPPPLPPPPRFEDVGRCPSPLVSGAMTVDDDDEGGGRGNHGNKRKRGSGDGDDDEMEEEEDGCCRRDNDDDDDEMEDGGGGGGGHHDDNSHKRVMSDAENLVGELRALREEMEEGTFWFKTQNERLCGEMMLRRGRGGTPMDQGI